MRAISKTVSIHKKRVKEFKFVPRIINPVKFDYALIFSANKQVRRSQDILIQNMPWLKVKVFSNPLSVSEFKTDRAAVYLFDDNALSFVDTKKIRDYNKDAVIVLLSSDELIHCSPPAVAEEKLPYCKKADLIFSIDQEDLAAQKIITWAVRCAEDKLNIEKYSRARRFIFLIVEDEPRWFSQFLPVLYNIIGQRADVKVTRTFEESLEFLFGVSDEKDINENRFRLRGHGDDVICVITDMFFPKANDLKCDAGRDLFRLVSKYYPRIPLMIASKAKEGYDLKNFAFIMPKGDSGSLQTLHGYIHDFTGMGDFFIRSKTGKVIHRISNIHQLYQILLKADEDSERGRELRELLEYYGRKDYFSTWLYMHGFRELGDKLRPKQDKGRRMITILKRNIKREILRMKCTPLKIDGYKICNLHDLLNMFRTIEPDKIQQYSDHDIFSTWFDRKGYSDLAEEFRPIHGSGQELVDTLKKCVEKWINKYENEPNV